ncbi:hypothetical protein RHA1_ro00496 [Rhodococcus jostii RHA1]|uniref:Uncharacterized protein n=1 Tax=Rhodococcus jostii (strain RHA1) TaxID=101510 RepID=Q0SJF4_RHOJR|nr:hypothetical protein RHA1_ro00496 [Rhodococcus jostii RHA1]
MRHRCAVVVTQALRDCRHRCRRLRLSAGPVVVRRDRRPRHRPRCPVADLLKPPGDQLPPGRLVELPTLLGCQPRRQHGCPTRTMLPAFRTGQ